MIKRTKGIIILILGLLLAAGCTKQAVLVDNIVGKVLEENNNIGKLYIEAESIAYLDNKMHYRSEMKIYQDYAMEKTKSETTIDGHTTHMLSEGDKMTMYNELTNQVTVMHQKGLAGIQYANPKDSFMGILSSYEEAFDISNLGQEKINGHDVYHMKITPKDPQGFHGPMESWIDTKNYRVVKYIINFGNMRTETTFTKYDLNPKFDESVFELQIPEDANVSVVDPSALEADQASQKNAKLEDVREALGTPFIYFDKNPSFQISDIKIYKNEDHNTATVLYSGKNNLTAFDMHMSYVEGDDGQMAIFDSKGNFIDMQYVEIRGKDGYYFDDREGIVTKRMAFDAKDSASKGYKFLMWKENHVSYSVRVIDDSIDLDELKAILSEMVYY